MSLSNENKVIIYGQTFYGGLNQPNLKFIKVNVDCWERIFDLLSLRDILAMSQTCQRMRQIGGYYFRENFHGTLCSLNPRYNSCITIGGNPIERDDFLRFIDTVEVRIELKCLRNVSSTNLFESLTTLVLDDFDFDDDLLPDFRNIPTNIESITLFMCRIFDNSFGEFLATCPKLKYLRIIDSIFQLPEAENTFFSRTYPMLELFNFDRSEEFIQLVPFLERNPSINCLQIDVGELRKIPLNTTTIQLDYLNIDIREEADSNLLLKRLKRLHANGLFKKLRLSVGGSPDGFDGEVFFKEMRLFSALEALETYDFYANALCNLTQLKELNLQGLNKDTDLDTMAMNLINLERLYIRGTIDQLLSFLRHSKKLKFVIFYEYDYNFNTFSLFTLNEVRKMGGMQLKTRIGVYEKPYLEIKWREKNVNYDLVEITRENTISKHFYYE